MRNAIIATLLGLLLTLPALAYDMSGVWASTSGSTITIPHSTTDFDLIVKHADGSKYLLHGRWSRNRVGREFRFTNEYGREATAMIDPADDNRVILTTSEGTYAWQRVRR